MDLDGAYWAKVSTCNAIIRLGFTKLLGVKFLINKLRQSPRTISSILVVAVLFYISLVHTTDKRTRAVTPKTLDTEMPDVTCFSARHS